MDLAVSTSGPFKLQFQLQAGMYLLKSSLDSNGRMRQGGQRIYDLTQTETHKEVQYTINNLVQSVGTHTGRETVKLFNTLNVNTKQWPSFTLALFDSSIKKSIITVGVEISCEM